MSGELAACINTCTKLADFCLKVNAAPEETRVFGRLIHRVRVDRAEALRERHEKTKALEDLPEKRKWVDDIIHDTTEALQTIGKLVEGARIDVAKGKRVSLQHRFEWVLSKKEDFLAKQSWLATCHRSLSNVLMFMQTLEARPRDYEPAAAGAGTSSPPDYAEAFLRSPSARKPPKQRTYALSDPLREGMKPSSKLMPWHQDMDITDLSTRHSLQRSSGRSQGYQRLRRIGHPPFHSTILGRPSIQRSSRGFRSCYALSIRPEQ